MRDITIYFKSLRNFPESRCHTGPCTVQRATSHPRDVEVMPRPGKRRGRLGRSGRSSSWLSRSCRSSLPRPRSATGSHWQTPPSLRRRPRGRPPRHFWISSPTRLDLNASQGGVRSMGMWDYDPSKPVSYYQREVDSLRKTSQRPRGWWIGCSSWGSSALG